MNKTHLAYFEKADVLHLAISDDAEAGSIEISPNITAELNEAGELIGIEILNASAFIRDSGIQSAGRTAGHSECEQGMHTGGGTSNTTNKCPPANY